MWDIKFSFFGNFWEIQTFPPCNKPHFYHNSRKLFNPNLYTLIALGEVSKLRISTDEDIDEDDLLFYEDDIDGFVDRATYFTADPSKAQFVELNEYQLKETR